MAAADHPPITARTRRLLTLVLVPLLALAVAGAVTWWPDGDGPRPAIAGTPVDATVVAVRQGACTDTAPEAGIECLRVEARVAGGGRVALADLPTSTRVAVGDDVVLRRTGTTTDVAYRLDALQRRTPLLALAGIAVLAVLVLARRRGLQVLVALVLAGVVLIGFVVPAVLDGAPGAGVGAVGGAALAVALVVFGRGVDGRHLTALAGTLLGIGAAAGLGHLAVDATRVASLDTRPGLLLAGLVVGAVGVAVDLAVRQVDAAWDLRDADPSAGWLGLTRAGIRRGRGALADASASLVVAYAGAMLPWLAVLTDDLGTLDGEQVAPEVVRALAGLLGLAAVVPLTAAVAAAVAVGESRRRAPDDPRRFRSRHERELWEP